MDSVETLSSNQKAQIQDEKVTRVMGGAGERGEPSDSPRGGVGAVFRTVSDLELVQIRHSIYRVEYIV